MNSKDLIIFVLIAVGLFALYDTLTMVNRTNERTVVATTMNSDSILHDVPDVYSQGQANQTNDNYTASEIAKIIQQADNNGFLFGEMRDKCSSDPRYDIAMKTCIALLDEFNYYMSQFWKDSKDEMGRISSYNTTNQTELNK